MNKKIRDKAVAVLIAFVLWETVYKIVGTDMLLASPFQVAKRLGTLLFDEGFFSAVLFSLLRITGGFALAFAVGILFAVSAGKIPLIETLLHPYVVSIKSVPVASFIILFLIWFSFGQLTVFISFLIAFPVIYLNVLQGIKSTDKNMLEMAKIYNVSWSGRLIYIYTPGIKPYLISACNIGMGMSWKAGIAAEVIGTVNGSVGEKLYMAKIYFQNADLLAWTVIIVVLSVVTEKIFSFLLKRFFAGVEKL